ncbi:MAG: hypothetical protein ACQBVK_01375 [Candidatus Phytoplasma sp. TWB_XP]
MNDLNFTIGFIVGALFTTALMFIIKKIFFNLLEISENNKISNQSPKLKQKENNNIIFPKTQNSNNEPKDKNNLEGANEINN